MKTKKAADEDAKQKNERETTQLDRQPLRSVLRALMGLNTRALVFEHTAQRIAIEFRGTESRGPTQLIAFANGTRCRAELEDVLEIEDELRRLALHARTQLRAIESVEVAVEREIVVRDTVPRGPIPPPPAGDGVVDVPSMSKPKPRE